MEESLHWLDIIVPWRVVRICNGVLKRFFTLLVRLAVGGKYKWFNHLYDRVQL
jgi:hypothetical protein